MNNLFLQRGTENIRYRFCAAVMQESIPFRRHKHPNNIVGTVQMEKSEYQYGLCAGKTIGIERVKRFNGL